MSDVFYTVAQNSHTACTVEYRKVVLNWIPGWTGFGYGQISVETVTLTKLWLRKMQ